MKGSSEGWREKEEVLVSVVPAALRPLLKGTPNGTTQTHSVKQRRERERERRWV